MTTGGLQKHKVFFSNLDGLRFISFISVFLFHVYLLLFSKYLQDSRPYYVSKWLFQNGEIGVNFFFVLSGYLITFLLIQEKKITGKIHVGRFYMRRILRIWPLFYLCIFFGLVLYPHLKRLSGSDPFNIQAPWTYFIFLNNFDFLYHKAPAIISVLWSVAVEEQFYFIWPWILKFLPIKKYNYAFITIIAVSLIFRAFNLNNERVLMFHTLAVIEDMAIGGLLAYHTAYEGRFKKWITRLGILQILALYLTTIIVIIFRKEIFHSSLMLLVERLIISFLFGFIILEQNFSLNSAFKLEKYKTVSKLGTYTYGLYCLHVIAITFCELALQKLNIPFKNAIGLVIIGCMSLLLSIGISFLSYNFYEKKFLSLKDKFSFIVKK